MMEVCNTSNQAAATCSASADSHGSNLKRKFKRRPRSDIGRKHETLSVPLPKRSLFAEGEEDMDSAFGNGDYVSDGDEIFGATSPLDDDCRTSSSAASSSAMETSPVAQAPAAKRLRKGK
jgi:hypothetical protein